MWAWISIIGPTCDPEGELTFLFFRENKLIVHPSVEESPIQKFPSPLPSPRPGLAVACQTSRAGEIAGVRLLRHFVPRNDEKRKGLARTRGRPEDDGKKKAQNDQEGNDLGKG